MNYPILVGVLTFLITWVAAHVGKSLSLARRADSKELEEFNLVLGATLTLLALIVGFAFSMAVGRYDQRKNYEEEEANAIGTEYVRADLLPSANADKIRSLLKEYLHLRVRFYDTRWHSHLPEINAQTTQLQNEMWSEVAKAANAQPTPVIALVVSGMNDVLNRQGYTQAAWWNRIPTPAWALMGAIALCCNLLVGVASHEVKARRPLIVIPIVLAIAFTLLADLDSPRGGIIRVRAQNLTSLADSLQ